MIVKEDIVMKETDTTIVVVTIQIIKQIEIQQIENMVTEIGNIIIEKIEIENIIEIIEEKEMVNIITKDNNMKKVVVVIVIITIIREENHVEIMNKWDIV